MRILTVMSMRKGALAGDRDAPGVPAQGPIVVASTDLRRTVRIALPRSAYLEVTAHCIARCTASDHDGAVRRRFAVYRTADGFACERVDAPDQLDERCWGTLAADALAIFEFFGTEPLANYLYGLAGLDVPGLTKESENRAPGAPTLRDELSARERRRS